MTVLRFFLIFTMAFALQIGNFAEAQDNPQPVAEKSGSVSEETENSGVQQDEEAEEEYPGVTRKELESERGAEYVEPTFDNIGKLYWALGKFDPNNDKHLDTYLKIYECELYLDHYTDDFVWGQVKEAARKHILSGRWAAENVSKRISVTIPIYLDRYDPDRKIFPLAPASQIDQSYRFDIHAGYPQTDCSRNRYDFYDYQANFVLKMHKPFILAQFPASHELARAYMEQLEERYEHLKGRRLVLSYERVAYLELRIRVINYLGVIRTGPTEPPRALMSAYVEGFDIYVDSDKTKPMYGEEFERYKMRRYRSDE